MSDFQGLGWLGAAKFNGSGPAMLDQPGKWKWLSGKPWDYTDWKPGEPSNKTHKTVKRVSKLLSPTKNWLKIKSIIVIIFIAFNFF